MKKLIELFFFGNIVLGIYAVALCIETNLLSDISLNTFPFYLLIFFSTCVYYTMIYVRSIGAINYNERTIWYRENVRIIKSVLNTILGLSVLAGYFLLEKLDDLYLITPGQLVLLILFPLVAAWYTFSPKMFGFKKIRQTGWIKPFVVGFILAGWVTIYPVLIFMYEGHSIDANLHLSLLLLFLQNFLFCSINAIIFDVKDYRTDSLHRLKTLPVIFGVKNTFRFIITPLIALNLIVFFLLQIQQQFLIAQTIIQLIPYVLLILVTIRHRQQRSVLYYLVAVDGLVFVKALCGITSILFIKK